MPLLLERSSRSSCESATVGSMWIRSPQAYCRKKRKDWYASSWLLCSSEIEAYWYNTSGVEARHVAGVICEPIARIPLAHSLCRKGSGMFAVLVMGRRRDSELAMVVSRLAPGSLMDVTPSIFAGRSRQHRAGPRDFKVCTQAESQTKPARYPSLADFQIRAGALCTGLVSLVFGAVGC